MKIQNTTQITFKFEGTLIEPGQIQEVKDEVGQRLLALWWHRGLELIEEKDKPLTTSTGTFPKDTIREIGQAPATSPELVTAPVAQETPATVQTPEPEASSAVAPVEDSFACIKCQQEFKSKRALDAHKKFSKTCQ